MLSCNNVYRLSYRKFHHNYIGQQKIKVRMLPAIPQCLKRPESHADNTKVEQRTKGSSNQLIFFLIQHTHSLLHFDIYLVMNECFIEIGFITHFVENESRTTKITTSFERMHFIKTSCRHKVLLFSIQLLHIIVLFHILYNDSN